LEAEWWLFNFVNMKILKQIDKKTRLIQSGKTPYVRIELQRKKWYGWSSVNLVPTGYCKTIEEYEHILLRHESMKKNDKYYGRIIHNEQF